MHERKRNGSSARPNSDRSVAKEVTVSKNSSHMEEENFKQQQPDKKYFVRAAELQQLSKTTTGGADVDVVIVAVSATVPLTGGYSCLWYYKKKR